LPPRCSISGTWLTNLISNPFSPGRLNGYAQILSAAMEASRGLRCQLSMFRWAVVVVGTFAENSILPLLIVIGLFTRLAAFRDADHRVCCRAIVDGSRPAMAVDNRRSLGAWFDASPTVDP
jgi:hypothetical protein